jgi:DNA-binding IclR family transcriptional regulator
MRENPAAAAAAAATATAGRTGAPLVMAAARALAVLDAFTITDGSLALSELGRRVQLSKATTLRLLRTLAASGYVVQLDNTAWRLGPATASLGARYQVAFDLHDTVEPALQKLTAATGQNCSFFVRDGDKRIRLARMSSTDRPGYLPRLGESLPLDKGATGQVILAASGRVGALYDTIRERGFHVTLGEAKESAASVAAAVFGAHRQVVGALCIGGPIDALTEPMLFGFAPQLVRVAHALSADLSSGGRHADPLTQVRGYWHP